MIHLVESLATFNQRTRENSPSRFYDLPGDYSSRYDIDHVAASEITFRCRGFTREILHGPGAV